jgi:hypothetical protein
VAVAPRWHKFVAFLEDMGERPEGTTLGRTTPFSDYGPGECEWQTKPEQNAGLRDQSKDVIALNGVAKTRSQWARDLGIKYNTLQRRKQRKWGDQAYTTPPGARRATPNRLK